MITERPPIAPFGHATHSPAGDASASQSRVPTAAQPVTNQPVTNQTVTNQPATNQTVPEPGTGQRPTAAPVLISLDRVSKVYRNGCQALREVNLQVRKGDFLFVTGPSGSGKSTFLKLLYGEEQPTQGEVVVNDVSLTRLRGNQLAGLRRQIGVVFQDYKLIPRRTVSENVAFVLWAQGFSRKEIHRRLLPTLKMVGLQDKAQCFPDELSGGEQQRVSIARAVVGTPPILLADEPTGNLDADNAGQVVKILQKLNAIGITVIVTTHDEHLIRMSNHPVVQIRNGQLFRSK